MVGVYSFIFASFIVTIVMLRLQRENYYYFADVFYSYTEWLVRIYFTNSYLVFVAGYSKIRGRERIGAKEVFYQFALRFCLFCRRIVQWFCEKTTSLGY